MAPLSACLLGLVAAASANSKAPAGGDGPQAGLRRQIANIVARAGTRVGVSTVHVETGKAVEFRGRHALPLYSVFKLPLAVAVLKDVEEGRLRLENEITVETTDVSPGSAGNSKRWKAAPVTVTVRQLIEFSMVESDNTASDKLLNLVGGPIGLKKRLRRLGLGGIDIRASTRDMGAHSSHANRASAIALTTLLVSLQRGQILDSSERGVLWDVMGRSRTGINRLRAALPPDTPVVDKTGTGREGAATNDVGIVTLPDDRGHVAIAVLISDSTLSTPDQERVIAEIARAVFDSHTPSR